MEYVSGKKVRMACYTASRHNVKRQRLSMESSSCKGILISPLSQKKMSPAVKEFLIYLKMHHSKNSQNFQNSKDSKNCKDSENSRNGENNIMSREENLISFKKEVKEINGIKESNKKEEDVENNESKEKRESKDNKENMENNMKNDTEETNVEKEERDEEEKKKENGNIDINIDEDKKEQEYQTAINVQKMLKEEIKQTHMEFERFSPIRNIVKNYTFIKFDESATDITPSDIVTKLFTDICEKKNRYKFRMICKIIPFDYVCKPHLVPFVKTIVPLLKKTFTEGNCVQKNMSPSDLLKLLNVSQEEREKVQAEEAEAKKKEENNDDNNDDNNNSNNNNKETKNTTVLENDKNKKIAAKEVKEDNEEKEVEEKKGEKEKKEKKKEKEEEGCHKRSWALIYKRANTDNLKKHDILTVIDNCIGKNYSVNLSNPDFAIIVFINEIMCGISIMKGYGKTKKLNISAFKENDE